MIHTENILKFCCEEVTRQGHDINDTSDGFPRVVGMIRAWESAIKAQDHEEGITLAHLRILARFIEPIYNDSGFRNCPVRIGGRLAPHWEDVPRLMNEWMEHWLLNPDVTADDIYLRFQYIHPFRDGNGRVGKIIHNWVNGTLDDPVLIKDYFGGGNP